MAVGAWRSLSCGVYVVGLRAAAPALWIFYGGVRVAEFRVVGPVVLSVVRSLRCRTTSVLDVFPSAHQFRT